jgi:hypothetical protein
MKIKKDIDVIYGSLPSCASGTNPFDNPGIKPSEKSIPMTAGEKATNSTSPELINKAQPFKKTGAGYNN